MCPGNQPLLMPPSLESSSGEGKECVLEHSHDDLPAFSSGSISAENVPVHRTGEHPASSPGATPKLALLEWDSHGGAVLKDSPDGHPAFSSAASPEGAASERRADEHPASRPGAIAKGAELVDSFDGHPAFRPGAVSARATLERSSELSSIAIPEEVVLDRSPDGHPAFSSGAIPAASLPGMPWFDEMRFQHQRKLTSAPRSGGQIELYYDALQSCTVAVKQIPRHVMRESPRAFREANPCDPESPWQEFAVLRKLSGKGQKCMEGVARCYGAYTHPNGDALLVIEHFPAGDLFALATRLCDPGWKREAQVFPLMMSLVGAVYTLHSRGIAHGDVSLENAMWRPQASGFSKVALIDFGAAMTTKLSQARRRRGKAAYQAPEMHMDAPYDARAADLFSLGVAVYALVLKGYPWTSTRPNTCRAFIYAQKHGCEVFFEKKQLTTEGGARKSVDAVLSPFTRALLLALFTLDPRRRMEAFSEFAERVMPSHVAACDRPERGVDVAS